VRIHRIAAISTAINLILLLAILAQARAMDPQNRQGKGRPGRAPLGLPDHWRFTAWPTLARYGS
jgi:hypothetical protein